MIERNQNGGGAIEFERRQWGRLMRTFVGGVALGSFGKALWDHDRAHIATIREQAETIAYYEERDAAREILLAELREKAEMDQLSSVYARHAFIDEFNKKIEFMNSRHREHREGDPEAVALLVFDGDKFKRINDKYGHGMGDAIITLTGEALHLVRKDEDVPGRFGGDEFLLGLSISHSDDAEKTIETVVERLQAVIDLLLEKDLRPEARRRGESAPDSYTLSYGATVVYRGENKTYEDMFPIADAKLLAVKEARGTSR